MKRLLVFVLVCVLSVVPISSFTDGRNLSFKNISDFETAADKLWDYLDYHRYPEDQQNEVYDQFVNFSCDYPDLPASCYLAYGIGYAEGLTFGSGVSSSRSVSKSYTFVINTSTKKFHLQSCKSVSKIKAENKEISHESPDTLFDRGYAACQECHPNR